MEEAPHYNYLSFKRSEQNILIFVTVIAVGFRDSLALLQSSNKFSDYN
jgi:hypothetical protein